MIIGAGLIANAFSRLFADHPAYWIYAAGVSNSQCLDAEAFARERLQLTAALQSGKSAEAFIYFSTCSVYDPLALNSAYVLHKLEMERLVLSHARYLIARLPQVAGRTNNPNTLLNHLYSKICSGGHITSWRHASRNIIDVDDVALILTAILSDPSARQLLVNIANPRSCTVMEIISAMEHAIGRRALTSEKDAGSRYEIDTTYISPIAEKFGIAFGDDYLAAVIKKYYQKPEENLC